VQAFRHSDLTGEALASGWIPGGEVIPTDFSKKVEYFVNKFGHGNKEKTGDGTENTGADDATERAKIEASPEEEAAAVGSEEVPIRSEDEKSDTKSKAVISEVLNSEEAAEDVVSAASFKSAEMSKSDETEAQKSPASAQKVSPKPAEANSSSPSAGSVPMAAVVVEEKKKMEN
jgi:hypothetical protein